MFTLNDWFEPGETVRNGLFSTLGHCDTAIPHTLVYCDTVYYLRKALRNPNVSAVVTNRELAGQVDERLGCIAATNPKSCFYRTHGRLLGQGEYRCQVEPYISPTARIHPTAVIGERCSIGDGVEIGPFVRIADDCVIDPDVFIDAGAVIGAEGVLFYRDAGRLHSVRHAGGVRIGRGAQILAQAVVARAIHPPLQTRVGERSVVGIASCVGHEAHVGDDCVIQGNCVLARQCYIDNDVLISSGSVVREYISVGRGAMVRAGSIVVTTVPPGAEVSGNFAVDHPRHVRDFLAKQRG